jgi:amino acid adenylation domain-containing protein
VHETLLAAAAARPDATAVVTGGRRHSYAELGEQAARLARALQDSGLARGDRVALFLDNGWPCVVSLYATLLAGGVVVVVNPGTRAEKLGYVLADSGARVLIASAELEGVVAAAAVAPDLRTTIRVGHSARPAVRGEINFDALIARPADAPARAGTVPPDLAALVYTSGSTGRPKGVMLSHQNMVFAMGSIAEYLRLGADDRILNALPLAFDYGMYQLLMAVYVQATLVLERSFAFPSHVLRRAADEQVTVFPLVPTMGATLLALADRRGDLRLPSVTRVTNTAAALPPDFVARLRGVFPSAAIFAMYGLTECKRVSFLDPALLDERPTSVGRAIPGTEVYLRSASGGPVAPGEPGILYVRGPHVMLGYWKQPELTARMLAAGPYPGERVLCTHDQFRMDEDGLLYFLGRTDDIIKCSGEKVSPVEIENVLHAIPGVREAVVLGVADRTLGEAVRAFVVRAEGATLTEEDVRRACLGRLERLLVPRDVIFVRELLKTDTGKVRRLDPRPTTADDVVAGAPGDGSPGERP